MFSRNLIQIMLPVKINIFFMNSVQKSTKYKDLNLKAPVNIKTFSHRWAPKHVITSYKAISMNKNINQYAI